MRAKFTISYQILTPKIMGPGKTTECGYYLPGGVGFVLNDNDGINKETFRDDQNGAFDLTLSEAIKEAKYLGISKRKRANLFTTPDYIEGDTIGVDIRYFLHCENVSPSTLNMIDQELNEQSNLGE